MSIESEAISALTRRIDEFLGKYYADKNDIQTQLDGLIQEKYDLKKEIEELKKEVKKHKLVGELCPHTLRN